MFVFVVSFFILVYFNINIFNFFYFGCLDLNNIFFLVLNYLVVKYVENSVDF